MDTLTRLLHEQLSTAVERAFGSASSVDVTASTQENFGHYQCNSALQLAKAVKKAPRQVAEMILDALPQKDIFAKIEIAGPGFINLTFTPSFLSDHLQRQLHDPLLGAPHPARKQRILIDFSSPNVAKELHVGHLRSTIIGDCLSRLFEFLGHDVLRINHLGDWGTQFGMLIAYMKEYVPDVLQGKQTTDLPSLMGWYRAAKKKFDEDPDFKKRSQLEVVHLQAHEPAAIHSWNIICEISRKGYQEVYNLLDIAIENRGESFYNPYLQSVIAELTEKGLVTISDGAKCIFLEGFKNREGEPMPLMVQKSDGGYTYDTTDLAAIRYRIFTDKAERIIYVTDNGQALHFQMIFAAAKEAHWMGTVQADHVGFGLVLGPDGKKFKTRSGDTEKLIDLIYEAIEHAGRILQERTPDMAPQEQSRLAHVLGVDAIKYADLSSSRTKDYTFSYDRMLRFEGNTAVFLLYAYVRIHGIWRKTGASKAAVLAEHTIALQHPSEMALGLHLARFGEILEKMSQDLYPNHLTDYLYTLAEKFNVFFRDCRVEGTPEEGSRLILCELALRVFTKGFHILGLKTVDRL